MATTVPPRKVRSDPPNPTVYGASVVGFGEAVVNLVLKRDVDTAFRDEKGLERVGLVVGLVKIMVLEQVNGVALRT